MRRQAAGAGAGAPTYAYIVKTANQTIASGVTTNVTAYDNSFTNDTVNFSLSLANGVIFILKPGIYAFWYYVLWTATFGGTMRSVLISGTFMLGFASVWVGAVSDEKTAATLTRLAGSGLGLCQDPGVDPGVNSDNRLTVFQDSGANQTLDRAHLAIIRLGDFS